MINFKRNIHLTLEFAVQVIDVHGDDVEWNGPLKAFVS